MLQIGDMFLVQRNGCMHQLVYVFFDIVNDTRFVLAVLSLLPIQQENIWCRSGNLVGQKSSHNLVFRKSVSLSYTVLAFDM
jgi:hypothetical protein